MIRNSVDFDNSDSNFGWLSPITTVPTNTTYWGEAYYNDFDWIMARQPDFGLQNRCNSNHVMMGMVYPGFDDANVPPFWNGGTARYIQREVDAGTTMNLTWDKVKSYTPKRLGGVNKVEMPWVQIITWNDWPEGTSIEPASDASYGFAPLETCQTELANFKNETPTYSTNCLRVPYLIYEAKANGLHTEATFARDLVMQGMCDEAYDFLINNECLSNQTLTSLIESGLYRASVTTSSSGQVVSGKLVQFKAGQSIELNANFEVETGAEFEAIIESCNAFEN